MAPTAESAGAFVPVNDLQMFVEEQGEGEPLLLIHGGLVSSAMWADHVPALAAHYRLILPDSRGHGRTVNPAGALTYQQMADDMAALIEAMGLGQPAVAGYSDGGQIALDLAVRYPDLARAVVIGGATYRWGPNYHDVMRQRGWIAPGVVDHEQLEQQWGASGFLDRWRAQYGAQGPEHWRSLTTMLSTAWLTPLPYADDDLRRVATPVLLLAGDRDEVFSPMEDLVAAYRLIPNAELAVVPGGDHGFPFSRPVAFTSAVIDFLLRHA